MKETKHKIIPLSKHEKEQIEILELTGNLGRDDEMPELIQDWIEKTGQENAFDYNNSSVADTLEDIETEKNDFYELEKRFQKVEDEYWEKEAKLKLQKTKLENLKKNKERITVDQGLSDKIILEGLDLRIQRVLNSIKEAKHSLDETDKEHREIQLEYKNQRNRLKHHLDPNSTDAIILGRKKSNLN
jgi:hypothetical protein